MKAGIVIDDWKLPIFERHLTQADYTYDMQQGVTVNTLTLLVEMQDAKALEVVVRAANTEAAKRKGPQCQKLH